MVSWSWSCWLLKWRNSHGFFRKYIGRTAPQLLLLCGRNVQQFQTKLRRRNNTYLKCVAHLTCWWCWTKTTKTLSPLALARHFTTVTELNRRQIFTSEETQTSSTNKKHIATASKSEQRTERNELTGRMRTCQIIVSLVQHKKEARPIRCSSM